MMGSAFSPSGISSFFKACTHQADGTPITDPTHVGALGGGFALTKGVTTTIVAEDADVTTVEVFINGQQTRAAKTTETVIEMLLQPHPRSYRLTVEHVVEVPIGAGFGTSAAGALSCGLALAAAVHLPVTYNHVARIAHVADVVCHTGLGTVEGLTVGGLVLVIESGAVGIGRVDRIPLEPDLKIVAGVFAAAQKAPVLQSRAKIVHINRLADETLQQILTTPTPPNFLRCCKAFALRSGLTSLRVSTLIDRAEKAGAIGATQNMIGEAVHALTTEDHLKDVYTAFTQTLPPEQVVVSDIDFQGARRL